jgi:hypothetical protein
MATVINNPSEGSGAGTIIGIVVAIILIALLFIYGLPALRGGTTNSPGTNINIDATLPTGGNSNGGGAEY